MKITMRSNGFEVYHENANEKNYLDTVLNRLVWVFNPNIVTWDNGIRIEGKGNLRSDVIEKLENK